MPAWSPETYLKFGDQRTRPSQDLVARVQLEDPKRIIDLGCGPGNSTAVCAARWPGAAITGLDSSPAMIEKARAADPGGTWVQADIGEWAESNTEPFDIVFSNAALHWLPNHGALFPQLLSHARPGGALAIQMPAGGAPNRVMAGLAASNAWRHWFPDGRANAWFSHDLNFYYDTLAPHASRVELWATDYGHVMPRVSGIVEWYKSTGLRPYLDPIRDEAERQRFLDEFQRGIEPHYPPLATGEVLFVARRIFVIAYR